ncbi:hypothetical protein ABMA08_17555 [Pseudomonas yamanorum]
MNGVTLAREISRRYSQTRLLLTTGYAQHSLEGADILVQEFELIPSFVGRLI